MPKDANQLAARIVAISTGQPVPGDLDEKKLRSQAAAVCMGARKAIIRRRARSQPRFYELC